MNLVTVGSNPARVVVLLAYIRVRNITINLDVNGLFNILKKIFDNKRSLERDYIL